MSSGIRSARTVIPDRDQTRRAHHRAPGHRRRQRLLGRPRTARALARRHRRMEAQHQRTRHAHPRRATLLTKTHSKINRYTTSRDLTACAAATVRPSTWATNCSSG